MCDCGLLPRFWGGVDHVLSRRQLLPNLRPECSHNMSNRQLLSYHRVDSAYRLRSWHVRCDYGQQRVYGMCIEWHWLRRRVCRVLQRGLR